LSLTDTNDLFIAVVTVGEVWSIARQNGWGENRINQLNQILNEFAIADINDDDVIQRYADIDAFSQNRLVGRSIGASARNMGKNDLWIASTASVLSASLITTDKDFNHLHGQFLDVIWIDPTTNP